jgi:hypothetical protein
VGTAVRSATTKTVINQSDGTQTFRVVPRGFADNQSAHQLWR